MRFLLQPSSGIAIVALLGASIVNGQRTTPSPPGSGGGRTSVSTSTGAGTTNSNTTLGTSASPESPRPIYVSGRVLLTDGVPPPQSITIERVCGSRVIPEGTTDRKGRFSFQLGQNSMALMNAESSSPSRRNLPGGANSLTGGVSSASLMNCELRASLPGFRSETVSLAMRRSLDDPDVGTIVLHRIANVEGSTVSATSLAAPKDARKYYDKGHEALGKGKLDDARKNLQKAVDTYPKYASAWYDLGVVGDREQHTDDARKAFEAALAADSKYLNPYEGLAQIAARERKWDEVADLTDRMIRLNPVDYPQAFFLNAVAKLNLTRLDAAEKSATALVAMDSRHQFPKGEQVLGLILLKKQDYAGAATHLRNFVDIAPPGPELDSAKKQLEQLDAKLAAHDQR